MKKALGVALARSMALSLVVYGGGSKPAEAPITVAAGDTTAATATDTTAADTAAVLEAGVEMANKDKPLVWFSRQPPSSATGQLDMTALNFNKDTYYIGFDTNQGAELQGTMVKDYIEKNIDSIDRNGDGIIDYVLAIGGTGHNGSIIRTRGTRRALGTAVEEDGSINNGPVGTNADGTATAVRGSSIEVGRKTYVVRELASQEMESSAGVTQDVAAAGNAIGIWSFSFGDQIDVVASNNDSMGMSMFNAWSRDNKVSTFGYDANSDVVTAIAEGYGGTINQHTDVQVYLTLRVLRSALDGIDIDIGIGTADDVGNVLSFDVYVYKADGRSYHALNVVVTAENYTDFADSTMVCASVSNQLGEASRATKDVWLNIYNSADNFLGSTYQPLLQKYDKLLNLKIDYIGGDEQTESNITNRPGSPSQYDAFVINMVKADNAVSYISLFEQ